MSHSNLTNLSHFALHRRSFLHGAAALSVAGAFPSMLTRSAFAAEDLPVQKQHYLIAFSNGDMNNSWRYAFVNSMEQWAAEV